MKRRTYHSFVRDRFNEAIEDFGKSMRTNPRTANIVRILVHTLGPVVTSIFQDWRASSRITVVIIVVSCASSHLREHLSYSNARLFVDIATDGGPETVENVHYAADEEHVEKELCVEGEDMG
jgi:hypothetical protein